MHSIIFHVLNLCILGNLDMYPEGDEFYMKKGTQLKFAVLCLVPFIMVLGNSMLIPVLPSIKSALNISQLRVGLLITAFSIPAGIVIPFAGVLSDHVGRVIIMVPALIIYGLGGLIAGIAAVTLENPYPLILAGRIIQGIGAGGTYQLAMALTGDIFKSSERAKALGFLEAANGLGKVISPLAGAAAGLISWYAPFFIYGILAIPAGIAIRFVVSESKENLKKQSYLEYRISLQEIIQKKAMPLISCFLAGMVALFVLFGTLSFYSDLLEVTFKIKGFLKGIIIAGPVLAMAVLSFSLGIFLEKRNRYMKTLIVTGLAVILIGQVLFAVFPFFWPLFAAVTLVGAGVGGVLPPVNTLITSSASTKRRGIITCLYGTVRFFGVAIGPPLYGFIEKIGREIPLALSSGIVAIAIIFGILFINERVIMGKEKSGTG